MKCDRRVRSYTHVTYICPTCSTIFPVCHGRLLSLRSCTESSLFHNFLKNTLFYRPILHLPCPSVDSLEVGRCLKQASKSLYVHSPYRFVASLVIFMNATSPAWNNTSLYGKYSETVSNQPLTHSSVTFLT